MRSMYEREIELSGHIIDSLALPKTMDIIMDKGGDFDILDINVGKKKSDISKAKILVSSQSLDELERILDELSLLGVSIVEIRNVELEPSPKDKVAPEGFYSTSNYATHVLYENNWIPVENIEMDCMVVIDSETNRAYCKPLNSLKKDDLVVVGREGVKVSPPERVRGKTSKFEFMNSDISSEKPLISIATDIASEIKKIKESGGKILLVAGPAIIHTGSAKFISAMIREGFIDVIFAGNALATHDIESDQFGTSLGIDIETGEIVSHGHTHHMRAINRINKSGSIKNAVEDGTLKSGIMYECVKNDIPFVLAGSIRDDGPLPDVETDITVSQARMRKYCQEVDMVLMVSTMLHSIATGNMLPADVKSICIDINPSTVTKLSDRGSAQVMSVVTDIGSFLPVLYECLHDDSFINGNNI